jgi:hypothetical protein
MSSILGMARVAIFDEPPRLREDDDRRAQTASRVERWLVEARV